MTQQDPGEQNIPIFRAGYPYIILALAGLICMVSLVQFNASPELEDWLFRSAAILAGPGFETIARPFGDIIPLIAHTALHGGGFHLTLNMVALISMGPIIALTCGNTGRGRLLFMLFFSFCAVAGGLAETGLAYLTGQSQIVIGASSAISGFLPAIGFVRGGWRGAWSMSAGWILINIAIALLGGFIGLPIAWAAHLGGLAAGFGFPVFLHFAASPEDTDQGQGRTYNP